MKITISYILIVDMKLKMSVLKSLFLFIIIEILYWTIEL